MKINDVYKADFLHCDDLGGMHRTVTITKIESGKFDDGKEQMICTLKEHPKRFGLNVTNAKVIAELHGDETDGWIGKTITLYPTRVDFQGKKVPAIRVVEKGAKPPMTASTGVADPKPEPKWPEPGSTSPHSDKTDGLGW